MNVWIQRFVWVVAIIGLFVGILTTSNRTEAAMCLALMYLLNRNEPE